MLFATSCCVSLFCCVHFEMGKRSYLMLFLIQIIALAKAGHGNVPNMTVMEPVQYMDKGITSLLTTKNSLSMGNVATSSLRYHVYLFLLKLKFCAFKGLSCDTDLNLL